MLRTGASQERRAQFQNENLSAGVTFLAEPSSGPTAILP